MATSESGSAFTSSRTSEIASDLHLSSDDDDGDYPHAPSSSNEKRRAQNAIFDEWLTTSAAEEILRASAKVGRKSAVDEEQSIHDLLKEQQQQLDRIITNPREYQLELFERAKRENTIAVLDTGSGKTLIAVLLLRWVIDNELESRAAGNPGKIAFFLCCSVALAFQQFSVLEANLDHKILRLCGNDQPDRFTKSVWEQHFRENKVIVCTPAVLEKCLSRGFISMKRINLLIFDEAHHTKRNHPYSKYVSFRSQILYFQY